MAGSSDNRSADVGLLLLRVGLGMMFAVFHGGPKLFGGPEVWSQVGMAMGSLGIHAFPRFWGFMAASSEFFGGVCLILGLFIRPAALFMSMTMAVATMMHFTQGDGMAVASHAIEDGIVFLSLIFIGPGSYSVDQSWFGRQRDASRYTLP
jgi:putative oxidoreductase